MFYAYGFWILLGIIVIAISLAMGAAIKEEKEDDENQESTWNHSKTEVSFDINKDLKRLDHNISLRQPYKKLLNKVLNEIYNCKAIKSKYDYKNHMSINTITIGKVKLIIDIDFGWSKTDLYIDNKKVLSGDRYKSSKDNPDPADVVMYEIDRAIDKQKYILSKQKEAKDITKILEVI